MSVQSPRVQVLCCAVLCCAVLCCADSVPICKQMRDLNSVQFFKPAAAQSHPANRFTLGPFS